MKSRGLRPSPLKAFSLLELLAVIAITATLMGFLVPAVSNLQKSGALTTSGNTLVNLAGFARENSMSKNAMTALIMLTEPDNMNRTFALMEYTPAINGTGSWRQISKWETLATGVIADDCTFQDSTQQPPVPIQSVRRAGKDVIAYKYALFLPTGGLFGDASSQIRIAEGFFPANANVPTYTHGTETNPADYYQITILQATGRVKIDRP